MSNSPPVQVEYIEQYIQLNDLGRLPSQTYRTYHNAIIFADLRSLFSCCLWAKGCRIAFTAFKCGHSCIVGFLIKFSLMPSYLKIQYLLGSARTDTCTHCEAIDLDAFIESGTNDCSTSQRAIHIEQIECNIE